MIATSIADARRFLAEEIRITANIRSPRLVDALASIPRERFLPPGPWLIRGVGDVAGPPRSPDDADPRHVYHDVAIALDAERNLYNGQPSLIARWLDELALTPGEHVLHIGCGAGYFTSLIAHVVGETGRVDAVDVDAELADRARVAVADTDDGEAFGLFSRYNAATPATCGVAMDVPEIVLLSVSLVFQAD